MGQKATCGSGRKSCKGVGEIVPLTPDHKCIFMGIEVVLDRYKVLCNCDDNFVNDMSMGIMGVAAAFFVLIAYYIYREIYNYGMKLVCALIAFLPRLALPIAIRKKAE